MNPSMLHLEIKRLEHVLLIFIVYSISRQREDIMYDCGCNPGAAGREAVTTVPTVNQGEG
jgi:hypothetical protein